MKGVAPEGWTNCKFTDVVMVNPPKPPVDKLSPNTPVTFVPMSAVDALSGTIVTSEEKVFAKVRKRYTAFQDNDVIFAKITPCMENGKSAIARNLTNGIGFGSTEFYVLRTYGAVLPDFIFHFIRQQSFRSKARGQMTGSVGQKRVPRRFLENVLFPLPPLPEQKRIVAKLDSLLLHARATNQSLDNLSNLLKNIHQSILNAAITGKLTEDWRAKYSTPKSLSTWQPIRIERVTKRIQYGYTASAETDVQGPKFLRITDIQNGKVNWQNVPSCRISEQNKKKYLLKKGDIVFARTGATTGKSFLIAENKSSIFASYLIRLEPDTSIIIPSYLYTFFQSTLYWKQIRADLSGSAQPNFNATKLGNVKLLLPPLEEQEEIVSRIMLFSELTSRIKKHVLVASNRVEKLIQTILTKAFRGELVPTEAELARKEGRDYETAEQLLARIKAEREKRLKLGKKVMRKTMKEKKVSEKERPLFKAEENRLQEALLKTKEGKLTPEQLFKKAGFTEDTVDDFYEELRACIKAGKVREVRPAKVDIHLEMVEL